MINWIKYRAKLEELGPSASEKEGFKIHMRLRHVCVFAL